ncbi:sensor histidine kinase [Aureimonas populi]|uniref:Blue-light-activated histidine kinase n=1 Tax=Aureimonas populi TaxID=1701758 RepID=A0ABW5CK47_9HYPH|nr:HWE histidine kinase domain-containing protein [Aureimonas populi]
MDRYPGADSAGRSGTAFMAAGGLMGAQMREKDWAATPLGPPEGWPEVLKANLATMLSSPQPMFIAWGAWGTDLPFFFNDSYHPLLGAKAAGALGRPFAELWSDIWDDISPIARRALEGEGSRFDKMPLTMMRNGFPEETWWSFAYMPLREASGDVVGLLCVTSDASERVRSTAALMAERERLTQLFEKAPSFMAVLRGPDHVFELANPAYQKLIGHREVLGRSVAEALPDAAAQGYVELLDRVYRTGQAFASTGAQYAVQVTQGGPVDERYVDFVYQPIIDTDGTIAGVFVDGVDVTERKQSETHLRLMINELNHRVKNSLATVQAIASQTFRDPERFEASRLAFSARLVALAKAHDILTETSWSRADLRMVMERVVQPHHAEGDTRFRLEGPGVSLDPKTALALSMAIHELCTNAVKYGALSADGGTVDITWTIEEGRDSSRLRFRWQEKGGPAVAPPQRKGFGSRLIERSLASELDGEVLIRYEPAGVVCTIDILVPPA